MKRSTTLRRRFAHTRYGLPAPGDYRPGYDVDLRHAYRALLQAMYNNDGQTRATWRDWMQRAGMPKQVTVQALSLAERRGHVEVRGGRYYITVRGTQLLHPDTRG